jgi:flagellar assembly protein FliH
MSMSFSSQVDYASVEPVVALMYRDVAVHMPSEMKDATNGKTPVGIVSEPLIPSVPSAEEIDELVHLAGIEAAAETEQRLRHEYEARAEEGAAKIREALELFKIERREYFTRVESDVVHLALAISTKILHREAQVDPMLVAALVRVSIDKLHDGSSVSVRVAATEAGKWRECLANPLNGTTVTIIEDAHLGPKDCILETDLGSANFSIDAQLKEVEQGFFDLLAQRPPIK